MYSPSSPKTILCIYTTHIFCSSTERFPVTYLWVTGLDSLNLLSVGSNENSYISSFFFLINERKIESEKLSSSPTTELINQRIIEKTNLTQKN